MDGSQVSPVFFGLCNNYFHFTPSASTNARPHHRELLEVSRQEARNVRSEHFEQLREQVDATPFHNSGTPPSAIG